MRWPSNSSSIDEQSTDSFLSPGSRDKGDSVKNDITPAPFDEPPIELRNNISMIDEELSVISESNHSDNDSRDYSKQDYLESNNSSMRSIISSIQDDESYNSDSPKGTEAILEDLNNLEQDIEQDSNGNMEVKYSETMDNKDDLDSYESVANRAPVHEIDTTPEENHPSFMKSFFPNDSTPGTPKTVDDEDSLNLEKGVVTKEEKPKSSFAEKLGPCKCILPVILMLVGLILGIVFLVKGLKNRNASESENTQTVVSAVSAREEALYALASGISGETPLQQDGSAQRNALNWLANTDEQKLTIDDPAVAERYALVVLYHSIGGEGHLDQAVEEGSPWLSSTSICEWTGITCDDLDMVTKIAVHGLSLEGTLPEKEIGAFGSLVALDMHDNLLNGYFDAIDFSEIPNLDYLDLSNNLLVGSIPSSFYSLTQMKYIYLSENNLQGTLSGDIGSMTSLYDIRIDSNMLNGTLPLELGNLVNLGVLIMHSNQFDGEIPSSMGNATGLHFVDLSSNQLSGSIPIDFYQSNLERVYLNNNQLTGSISPDVGNLSNVVALWLQHNQLSGVIPLELKISSLLSLLLYDNKFESSVPERVCRLVSRGSLVELEADCSICTCCTVCH